MDLAPSTQTYFDVILENLVRTLAPSAPPPVQDAPNCDRSFQEVCVGPPPSWTEEHRAGFGRHSGPSPTGHNVSGPAGSSRMHAVELAAIGRSEPFSLSVCPLASEAPLPSIWHGIEVAQQDAIAASRRRRAV
ncbi:hypothetical protein CPLU01_03414 [Colletotrichum plurivorum]|uniref:Uncharacterized protein n=1 Tax=Colletotrichum plurivorum TaxID=2175906 RepID=A0A8H6KT54_9PEZI|nr:hypothetical protein CPLU01_03414 [Colletotrichum plurivorum]